MAADHPSYQQNNTGRTALARDNQQWILDYLVQETGKPYHFQGAGRGPLPAGIRSQAMISKHLGKSAQRLERYADQARAAGYDEIALDFFYNASVEYGKAQHTIFELNDEKRYLHEGIRRCFEAVCALSPYPLRHIQIPWGDVTVSGNLHINPSVSGAAPLLFYIPGCDSFKEAFTHPRFNFAHVRGMHLFVFDGPGHAESLMKGITLTADNHEEAASAAIDHLADLPEVDAENIVVYANSFASIWGMRLAASDHRIRALAAPKISISDKVILGDLESPRWKQLLAFATGAASEPELDAILHGLSMDGRMSQIRCPVLMTAGEYDPRSPLHDVYRLFDELNVPAELWVMADQHHNLRIGSSTDWVVDGIITDWLNDRIHDRPMRHQGKAIYVDGDTAPFDPAASVRRNWFE